MQQPEQTKQSLPLAVSVNEACRMTSIGRTKLYAMMSAGDLPYRKIGSRTIILMADIRKLLNLPNEIGSEE
jgi:excisionase family DNA binding protein